MLCVFKFKEILPESLTFVLTRRHNVPFDIGTSEFSSVTEHFGDYSVSSCPSFGVAGSRREASV